MTSVSLERLQFADGNNISEVESVGRSNSQTKNTKSQGCYISTLTGFILILLTIVIAVGIGVIVFFGSYGRNVVCNCKYPDVQEQVGQSSQALKDVCTTLKNHDREICLNGRSCPQTLGAALSTLTPVLSTTPAPPAVDVRLPGHFYPRHYKIELYPDLYKDDPKLFKFSGKVEIHLETLISTSEVILHINKLNIDDATVAFYKADGSTGPNKRGKYVEDKKRQFFILQLDRATTVGENYTISMEFQGNLTGSLAGLYSSQYNEGNATRYIAATQFQPTDARKAFPCFDEPGIKSTFDIVLVRKPHMTSLSNMPIKETVARPDGLVADIYERTVKMPTYLLAFIVCDFAKTEGVTENGIKFRIWSRKEAINQTLYALETGIKILTYFEEYFDIPFPLPKQDMIAIPDFAAGAMENWGLITYRETALLYDENGSSASNKQRVAVVVSHELAHQWFGNLVTPGWWDDLWLNEGFASYVEYLGVNHCHPDWKMPEQFVTEDLEDVFRPDGLATSHPIYVPVNHPDEINSIFDRISYGKGASVIRMMNRFLTEGTFRQGLTNYLNKHQYGNTHHRDLWAALTEQAESEGKTIDVGEVMNTWVEQMGYPVVTITRDGSIANVKQQHFLIDPTQEPSPKYPSAFGYKWHIHLSYTTASQRAWETPSTKWMPLVEEMTLTGLPADSADWVLGNVQQTGYYRVDYDRANWQALTKQLKNNHLAIHMNNRAQLIDDAFNLARAGIHNVDTVDAMETTKYLSNERDYIPWESAIVNLDYIRKMLSSTAAYGEFRTYMLHQTLPLYETLGWNESNSNPHLDQYLRTLAISRTCYNGHQPCLDKALQLFQEWMRNPDVNPIHPNVKAIVYCNAIRNGGIAEWDFVYSRFRVENLASERSRLLASLSCSNEPWILSRYLSWTIDENYIRKQDSVSTTIYISRNPIGRPLAWDFMRSNWNYIFDKYGTGFFAFTSMLKGITESFNTEFQLQQVRDFLEIKKAENKLGSGHRALEQAIEKTTSNIKWMDNNYEKLKTWLENYNNQRR
ncbi:unnamed protein product [Owenia fusiformis]|uniref:glutamyl aminopeptidase n=1 Tax=Owenia fusiformis TaxID=6347 RepID=A0A8S4P5H1_OWEFU|nr:unnamed protein product [Owenia fusiformis]